MNQNILYLECNSGISGDMTVAALLDLGADRQVLMDALDSLPLTGYTIEIKDVWKSGVRACDFHVVLDAEHENHDHDMEYLHGGKELSEVASNEIHVHGNSSGLHNHESEVSFHVHKHESNVTSHAHEHESNTSSHAHEHESNASSHTHEHLSGTHALTHEQVNRLHAQTHIHTSEAFSHSHSSRNLQDITAIIHAGRLTGNASELAIRIFEILAKAEAEVHGKEINEVHFHEVGAVDSIVDIVAAAVCLDNLHPDEVVVSTLTEGCGQIRCQHGLIPVPVPAVTAIAMHENLVLKLTDIQGELVTPTGAAIAAAIRTRQDLPQQFQIRRVGLGAGKRDYATAGVLRAMWLGQTSVGDEFDESGDDDVLVLETNIDDCTGEALAFTMQKLMEAGALDVFYLPIYMKKNRPAYLLKVICNQEDRQKLESIIFHNTTTIGIRRQAMHRTKLPRRVASIKTPWGTADIKYCGYENEPRCFPENDSVSKLADENGIGFSEMYRLLQEFACK
ncbi:MAG: nickel pincer cofactor biosynthesis protein LarC [Lachnospiraceae bacterium]|nr:nickel pincer cofactor biosynthesis protein LarC [Lachnospiraceae bacterium]